MKRTTKQRFCVKRMLFTPSLPPSRLSYALLYMEHVIYVVFVHHVSFSITSNQRHSRDHHKKIITYYYRLLLFFLFIGSGVVREANKRKVAMF